MSRIWLFLKPKQLHTYMNIFRLPLAFLAITMCLVSCKNETKTEAVPATTVTENTSEETKKPEKTEVQKKMANSLMAKLMATPETKMFMSNAVSAGITDMLSKNDGPYTLMVPSNEAFSALPETVSWQTLKIKRPWLPCLRIM